MRRKECECGKTFATYAELREHRVDDKHDMVDMRSPGSNHRGPASDSTSLL